MNKEVEIKWVIEDKSINFIESVINLLRANSLVLENESIETNNDTYYDNRLLKLYNTGESLRIRTTTKDNKIKYKGTYKTNNDGLNQYMTRDEYEYQLPNNNFDYFRSYMIINGIDLSDIQNTPIITVLNKRHNYVFSFHNQQVCFSYDQVIYKNHVLGEILSQDEMIEVEALTPNTDSLLKYILIVLNNSFNNIKLISESKYQRGINKTIDEYSQLNDEIYDPNVMRLHLNQK